MAVENITSIGFAGQADMIRDVADSLIQGPSGMSSCLVIPPCFNASMMPRAIKGEVLALQPNATVAAISSDEVKDTREFLLTVARRWNLGTDLRVRSEERDGLLADELFGAIPSGESAILIISRFEKFLETVSEAVLAKLRTMEEAGRIRTVTISIYDYDWLRRFWLAAGRKLLASDYGSNHRICNVTRLSQEEFREAASRCGVGAQVAQYAYELSGGLPLPAHAVLFELREELSPSKGDCRNLADIERLAAGKLRKMVEHLDCPGEQFYRDRLIDLYHGVQIEKNLNELRVHPWRDALIDGGHLVTPLLGRASVDLSIEDHNGLGSASALSAKRMSWAKDLYEAGDYHGVVGVLSPVTVELTALERVYLRNAKILSHLVIDRRFHGIDANWQALQRDAEEGLGECKRLGLSTQFVTRLSACYTRLSAAAAAVLLATSSGERIVDVLSGLRPGLDVPDKLHALMLLEMYQSIGETERLDSRAVNVALFLPEQLIAVWAMWAENLNFYRVPEGCEEVWRVASEQWERRTKKPLAKSESGEPFPGIQPFAYFALASCLSSGRLSESAMPVKDFKSLSSQLAILDVRNAAGHSLSFVNAKRRRNFFQMTRKWLDCIWSVVQPEECLKDQVIEMLSPLPLPSDREALSSGLHRV